MTEAVTFKMSEAGRKEVDRQIATCGKVYDVSAIYTVMDTLRKEDIIAARQGTP